MEKTTLTVSETSNLLKRLIADLADSYDAHGVCAAVSQAIAEETKLTTVVALNDPVRGDYDSWTCGFEGKIKQARWPGLGATIQKNIDTGRPATIERHLLGPGELIISDIWQIPEKDIYLVPLPYPRDIRANSRPGAIILIDPVIDDPFILGALNDVAAQVSVFLDRCYMRHEINQQKVEFGMVSDISYFLTATLDLDQIFTHIADAIGRALGTEAISIGLIDSDTDEITFVDVILGPEFEDKPSVKLDPGQGIAGWVAAKGQPAVVNNVRSDFRFYGGVDKSTGFETRSILCVPLLVEKRVIGVLEAINKRNGAFDKNDLRLVLAISGPLAVAIDNARLHKDVISEKRRIETIFENMSEGLITTGVSGNIRNVNDSFLTLLGAGSDIKFVGKPIFDLVNTKPTEFKEYYDQLTESKGEFPQFACDLRKKNGDFVPVLISGADIRDKEGRRDELVFVFSDLRLVREVERMRDDFFNNIVHELHTPLASILMYARLLREGKAVGDTEKKRRFLGVIERESNRLQKMVRQMLLLAKMEARETRGTFETVKLSIIIDQVLPPLIDRATIKGLTFQQEIEAKLPEVVGNEETMVMVITNLVENAIKFTPSGTVSFSVHRFSDQVSIEISDDGIGIPQEALPNLYQRFYRASTAVERGIAGSGLGLYMVKEGLERFGGSIIAESVEGSGTTFKVNIPIAPE